MGVLRIFHTNCIEGEGNTIVNEGELKRYVRDVRFEFVTLTQAFKKGRTTSSTH